MRCSEQSHDDLCNRPSKCSNSAEEHQAYLRDCFSYKLEKEALTVQTREKISYSDAKKKTTDHTVKPNESDA